jgi:hypothetical protein
MENVTVSCCEALRSGGGIFYIGTCSPELINCSILGNKAKDGGGLNFAGTSSVSLYNVLIASNLATSSGGGIHNGSSNTQILNNVTVATNYTTLYNGGGIYNDQGTLNLNNSIVWGNFSSKGAQLNVAGGSVALSYSCYNSGSTNVQGTITADANCITSDPKFVNASGGDYSILGISPCVDAGFNSYNTKSYDIRGDGYPRISAKTSGGISRIDMGAYEYKVGSDALPVELTAFTASASALGVELYWTTATELNNYGFEIERAGSSESGILSYEVKEKNFQKIGFVAGAGNSNSYKAYTFTDKAVTAGKYLYRLKQIDNDGKYKYSEAVEANLATSPVEYSLQQNYPNPFNPSTVIKYQLPEAALVTLKIYDILGREVTTLVNEFQTAGSYNSTFSIQNSTLASSGIYIAKLNAGKYTKNIKMSLIK